MSACIASRPKAAVCFPMDAQVGYVCGGDAGEGVILKTTNGGTDWVRQTADPGQPITAIDFPIDPMTGFAVGWAGAMLRTIDGGDNWEVLSPGVGNDLSGLCFPDDPQIGYAVGSGGLVIRTTDGGANWTPIFDSQPVSSIGSLAVAPSDANVVWAGTGETFIRSDISQGNGIYKSTDAGKNWKCMGLENTGRIGRIVVDPRNPDVVFAAAMGHAYGPQQERGVYRTTDGGQTWERVLFVDENTGCSDIAMDPSNDAGEVRDGSRATSQRSAIPRKPGLPGAML